MVDCACDSQLNFKKINSRLLITIAVVEVFQKTQEVVRASSVKKIVASYFFLSGMSWQKLNFEDWFTQFISKDQVFYL